MYVRPTTKRGSLKPAYIVSVRLSGGVCREHSEIVSGEAYECSIGQGGHGTCWPIGKPSASAEVFCVRMPWEYSGVEIGLQKPLEPSATLQSRQSVIWGVELTSGQRCFSVPHSLGTFHGEGVYFLCGSTGFELLGEPNKAQPVWTMREVVAHFHKDAAASHSVGPLGRIAVAWYGVGAAS